MAVVPKPVPVATQPSVSANRTGASSRVASHERDVDELHSSTGVNFDSANFRFHEEDRSLFDRSGGNSRQRQTGLFTTPTQAFAAMFDSGGVGRSEDNSSSAVKTARFGGLVSKAISIYEDNAKVVSGEANVLGTSISLVL